MTMRLSTPRILSSVILEHAILPVRTGAETDFESAFSQARSLISSQPGFRSLSLSRSTESPSSYLLLVEWDTIEAHTEGFRASAEYQEWKRLLHHFYEPFPTVEHFVAVS
ncbi:antibiotic biosynthesis monooxygenase [soil metagenome]